MKDYYDIHFFSKKKWKEVNKSLLKNAIIATFSHRNSTECLQNFDDIILCISSNNNIIERWNNYKEIHEYASNIEFEEVIDSIKKVYDCIK